MLIEQTQRLSGKTPEITLPPASKAGLAPTTAPRLRPGRFLLATGVLLLCFCIPLRDLLQLASADSLYSDIPLIPIISLYLVWQGRKNLPHFSEPSKGLALLSFIAGLMVMAIYWSGAFLIPNTGPDYLAINIFAFLLFFTGVSFAFLGARFMSRVAFPFALLVFMIPLPVFARHQVETFLQYGSAMVAQVFFNVSGMPSQRDGTLFQLPGINLQVAPECSGIHSSMVLLILSLIAGYLCLRSPWRRGLLALVVIPLALLRNGFRIFVIGQLCVRYGPQMLDAPIHRHGGPLFFALSLVLFFPLLLFLRKKERAHPQPSTTK